MKNLVVLLGMILSGFTGWFAASNIIRYFSCPGQGSVVRVIPDTSLNVRPQAGGNIPGNSFDPKRSLTFADGERTVLEGPTRVNNDDWLRVNEGWIWNHDLTITCPSPTQTPVFLSTATPRPTSTTLPSSTPQPTPTRIRNNFIWCKRGSVTVTPVPPSYDLVLCDAP